MLAGCRRRWQKPSAALPTLPSSPSLQWQLVITKSALLLALSLSTLYLLILLPRCQLKSVLVIEGSNLPVEVFLIHLVDCIVLIGWRESLWRREHDSSVIRIHFSTCSSDRSVITNKTSCHIKGLITENNQLSVLVMFYLHHRMSILAFKQMRDNCVQSRLLIRRSDYQLCYCPWSSSGGLHSIVRHCFLWWVLRCRQCLPRELSSIFDYSPWPFNC